MDSRFARWLLVPACVALGLGLAGCGGSGSSEEAPADAMTGPTETTPKGGLTKPGTKLKLGETAHVTFRPLNASATSKKTYKLDVTVLGIEQGSIDDDFEKVDLPADQKAVTPYYVSVRVSNPGPEVPVEGDDPDIRFGGIDDRGHERGRGTFIGSFERCNDTEAPTPFANGESYESCLVYLIPGGGSIQQVNWSGSDEYVLKPVTWK